MSVTIHKDLIDGIDNYEGVVGDDHELSYKARRYAETEFKNNYKTSFNSVNDDIIYLDLSKIVWKTSTRAKRRHGVAKYKNNTTHIVLSEHTFEKGGFESIKTTIRHELAHAFQYQHKSKKLDINNNTININTGHKKSFKYFDEEWNLQGRCSSYYENTKYDYEYIIECPSCNNWWGKHRLCKTIRQAVTQERYCNKCDVYLYVIDPNTGNSLKHKPDTHSQSQKDELNTIIKQFYKNSSNYNNTANKEIKHI